MHTTGLTVFPLSAGGSVGDITVLRDPRLRVLTTLDGHPPIDTHVTEVRVVKSGASTSFTVPRTDLIPVNGELLRDTPVVREQFAVMVNGSQQTVLTVTGTSTLTFTMVNSIPNASNVDIILFRSYWWAEATLQYADRYGDTVVRANTSATDLNVALPTNLRDELVQRGSAPTQFSAYNIDARYWTGSAFAQYTQVTNGNPTTNLQFTLSDGGPRHGGAPVTPSTLFMTFGAWETGVVRPVYVTRHRALPHNGGRGINGNQLELAMDKQRFIFTGTTTGTAATQFSYRLWDSTDTNQVTGISTLGYFMSLDGHWANMGTWNPSSVIRAISFTNTRAPSGMVRVPAYGLPDIADYWVHSYPTATTTFASRLVLAGMPHDPLLVAFSAVYDSRTPEEPLMFFQEDPLDQEPATAAFTVRLDSTADDRVVSLEEYQGSLFVVTKRAIFRIAATGRTNITADNYYVSSVATVGAPNANCVVRPEGQLMVLTRNGLYQIGNGSSANEFTEYLLTEVSAKVSPLFDPLARQKSDTSLWWASYSTSEHLVYIGLSKPGDVYWTTECYTVDPTRGSWSEFTLLGGTQIYSGVSAKVGDGQDVHYLLSDLTASGAFTLLETGAPFPVDAIRDLGGSSVLEYTAPRPPVTSLTTIYNVIPGQGTASGRVYKVLHPMSPATGIQDVHVTLGGVVLTPGVDYDKLPGNYIRLAVAPASAQTLTITPRSLAGTNNEHFVVAIVDGMPTAGLPFGIKIGTTPTASSWVRRVVLAGTFTSTMVGVEFQSVLAGGVFTFGSLTRDKRLSAVTLYQERMDYRDRWYGTYESRVTASGIHWPSVVFDPSAGSEFAVTDMPVQYYDAMVSLILDEERTQTHPIRLFDERDFLNLAEGTTVEQLDRPPMLQAPLGSAIRRTFSDVVTVVQPVLTSVGARQFGLSGIQFEATQHPSTPVSRTR
jgi:hypothetical protein